MIVLTYVIILVMVDVLKKYRIFLVLLFVVSGFCIALFYQILKPNKTLPIFSPSDVNPELVDTTVQHVQKFHRIAPFSFINQNGERITDKEYEGKIYVADFFFTTCTSICPIMTKNMQDLQQRLLKFDDVKMLSHTVMPDIDSVPVLKSYAIKHQAIDGKWDLVTGDKKEIYAIARKSYLVVKTVNTDQLYDMVHTENFVLVDAKKRVRGFYDGTDKKEIDRLEADIKWLIDKQ